MHKKILGLFLIMIIVIGSCFLYLNNLYFGFKSVEIDRLEGDNKNVDNFVPTSTTLSFNSDLYNININIPITKLDKDLVMNSYIMSNVEEFKKEWRDGGEEYNNQMLFRKQDPTREVIRYEYTIDFDKYVSQKLGTETYAINEYVYTGGAHGDQNITTFSFNQAGQLNIDNILDMNNGNDIKILKSLKNKILSQSELKDYTDENTIDEGLGLKYLTKDGKLDKLKCKCYELNFRSNLQNFIISDEGLTFVMDKYQVAAGAVGNPQIKFRWSELGEFMNKDFELLLD